jgi:hypothetical protein
MGAIQSNSALTFLTISDGKICRRLKSPSSTSITRQTKDGRTVHEEVYSGWKGVITNVKVRDTDYGKEWQVYLDDEQGTAVLGFKYSSGYASSFLKALPNVKLSAPVTLSPKMTIEGDKKRTTLFINQDGPVKWFYTKDNPNGLPGLKQIKVKGQVTWDDSEMMEFLENMVKDLFSNDTPF